MTPNRKHANNTLYVTGAVLLCVASIASAQMLEASGWSARHRRSHLAARRAADDSRPLATRYRDQAEAPVVMGKFKAPAPERVHRQRLAKSSSSASQQVSASFRVADHDEPTDEKATVTGIAGISKPRAANQMPRPRLVSAQMLVSDQGLNYPPSKLSADIHGNVAEIVTAPPEAVESDFLFAPASKLFGRRET